MKKLSGMIVGSLMLIEGISVQADAPKLTDAQVIESRVMVKDISSETLSYRAAVMQRMLAEANYFSDRLKLPMPRPIQMDDVVYPHINQPWFAMIRETNPPYLPATTFGIDIYNTNIPREQRLRALQFGVSGTFETTNFFFSFLDGRLCDVERLSEHEVEYYAHDLDKLVGKPSLIDTNGAYQLATQWLAAVDIDMTAFGKLKWTVSQLRYLPRGSTNTVTLPIYYVDFGSRHHHWPQGSSMKDFDEPLVTVEILGTTKELQELRLKDTSFSHRPQMLITNALELFRTPNPPEKSLQPTAESSKINLSDSTNTLSAKSVPLN